jgi:hypothetical protein
MVDEERKKNEEIMKLLEEMIVKSGFFVPENIPELMITLKAGQGLFERVNTRCVFDGSVFLSVAEKKALGLNTRMKYSKHFIEYFKRAAFKTIEPKAALECMHLDAFHRVSRKMHLAKLRGIGVKQVRVAPVGDARDCGKVARMKKVYRIDEVPELPVAGCDSPYCRCIYEAIFPEVDSTNGSF